MKRTALLLCTLCIFSAAESFGQKTNDLISFRLGYSSTNVVIKEGYKPPDIVLGNIKLKTGMTFIGDGPELGISKYINSKIFIDLGFSTFAGSDIQVQLNNEAYLYHIKGYTIPLLANCLIRKETKKLRINAGAGFQYLNAHLQQYYQTSSSGGFTSQLSDINISELQLAIRPGVQYQFMPNIIASIFVTTCLSANGRYSDHACFSVKYTVLKKKIQ